MVMHPVSFLLSGPVYFLLICNTWALGYLGGRIRSLSKLKNTPKALNSGQKSTLILVKTLTFPLNKHFYQNTDIEWTGTRILTLDFIILFDFSDSKWRQQTRKPSHFVSQSKGQAILFDFFGHIDVILRKTILNTILPFWR